MHVLLLSSLLSPEIKHKTRLSVLKYAHIESQHGSGVASKCVLVVLLMWISPRATFSSLFYLSSASPSAGVSNIEIRNITVHGEQGEKHTRQQGDQISATRMHKITSNLQC